MSARKGATITVNLALGLFVVLVGLAMLPLHLGLAWGLFNVYIWIAAPITLLMANKKQRVIEATATKHSLRIEVVESKVNSTQLLEGQVTEVKEVIDEKRFMELYGEQDLTILKHNGEVGDVIGQGRWYRAKILRP